MGLRGCGRTGVPTGKIQGQTAGTTVRGGQFAGSKMLAVTAGSASSASTMSTLSRRGVLHPHVLSGRLRVLHAYLSTAVYIVAYRLDVLGHGTRTEYVKNRNLGNLWGFYSQNGKSHKKVDSGWAHRWLFL